MVQVSRNEAHLLMGTPKVLGSYTQQHASVQVLGMWDGMPVPFTEGDWDYFDFNAAIHPPSPTNTFGGVSLRVLKTIADGFELSLSQLLRGL